MVFNDFAAFPVQSSRCSKAAEQNLRQIVNLDFFTDRTSERRNLASAPDTVKSAERSTNTSPNFAPAIDLRIAF